LATKHESPTARKGRTTLEACKWRMTIEVESCLFWRVCTQSWNRFKTETAEMIAAQARARGLYVDDYLSLLPPGDGEAQEKLLYSRATPEELARAYAEWAASHKPNSPFVLDDSRESLYDD
jgi:hypothetical protein